LQTIYASPSYFGIVTLIEGGRNGLQHCPFSLPRSRNPKGNKAPDNLLSLGMSLSQMGKKAEVVLCFAN